MPADISTLIYWCKERELMRLRKAQGEPAPYTSDPHLATYRFCNLHRRHDRVSRWLIDYVLTPKNLKADLKTFLMFAAWCRWVNWPPTIQAALDANLYPRKTINWRRLGALVDERGKETKVWTGAYMIRAPKTTGAKKGAFVSEIVVGTNFRKAVPQLVKYFESGRPTHRSYQDVWKIIQNIDGYGSFMAGQIAGDLTYTPLLNKAFDLTTFAPMGPGSVRGMNRLMGVEKINKKPTQEVWSANLVEWRAQIIADLGPEYEDLTALDVQNALCETDKLLRLQMNQGRPRAKYHPHTY